MNFFGHAVVALDRSAEPAFVFGAMLPDFAGMVGARVTRTRDHASLQRGIDLHHRTDDAFHGSPEFLSLCRDAVQELEAEGVARASARAVAHVGTELLLDGWLSTRDEAVDTYRRAMLAGPELIESIVFRSEDDPTRFSWLLSRLAHAPIPQRYAEPEFVSERLVFALAPRPRLALTATDAVAVSRWLIDAQPRVHERAPALIERVRGSLGDAGY